MLTLMLMLMLIAETTYDFTPTAGAWVVREFDTLADSCNVSEYSNQAEAGSTLQLTLTDGDHFSMIYDDTGLTLECAITNDEGDYDCALAQSTDTTAQDIGVDCLILLDIHSSGRFVSFDEVTIDSNIGMDANGNDCGMLALMGVSMPCAMVTKSNVTVQ